MNPVTEIVIAFSNAYDTANGSEIDLLNQLDDIYQINEIDQKSYIIDKLNITPEELHAVKYNSLSDFMRDDILRYHLGKWNNNDPSSIKIHSPSSSNNINCVLGVNNTHCSSCLRILDNSNISLDKLSFNIEGLNSNRVFHLKDYWPTHGADLSFKPAEGLKIRQSLGLGLIQDIKFVTTKELPSIPSPESSTSLELNSINESDLLSSSTAKFSTVQSPTASSINSGNFSPTTNNWTVEAYHSKKEHLNKALPELPITKYDDRNYYAVKMLHGNLRRTFEVHSVIIEENSDSLLEINNSSSSSSTSTIRSANTNTISSLSTLTNRDPYSFSPTYEFRSEVLNILTEDEINEINAINANSKTSSNLIIWSDASTSTSNSATLINRPEFQSVDWRSGSPLHINTINNTSPISTSTHNPYDLDSDAFTPTNEQLESLNRLYDEELLPSYEHVEPLDRLQCEATRRLTNLNTPTSLVDLSDFQNVNWRTNSTLSLNRSNNLLSEID